MNMPRVAGIDPSLTKTGVGMITQLADGRPCKAVGTLVKHRRPVEKAKRAKVGLPPTPTLPERRECFVEAARDVLAIVGRASLVVIHAKIKTANTSENTLQDDSALWWAIAGPLARAGVPIAVVRDVSARKAVTGSGRHEGREAAKVATALAVRGLWPGVELDSDDVADALGSAHLGAVALGWNVSTLKRHHDVKWQEWPLLPDPAAVA